MSLLNDTKSLSQFESAQSQLDWLEKNWEKLPTDKRAKFVNIDIKSLGLTLLYRRWSTGHGYALFLPWSGKLTYYTSDGRSWTEQT